MWKINHWQQLCTLNSFMWCHAVNIVFTMERVLRNTNSSKITHHNGIGCRTLGLMFLEIFEVLQNPLTTISPTIQPLVGLLDSYTILKSKVSSETKYFKCNLKWTCWRWLPDVDLMLRSESIIWKVLCYNCIATATMWYGTTTHIVAVTIPRFLITGGFISQHNWTIGCF